MSTTCCGVRIVSGPDDDGAIEAFCKKCSAETCSKCAASFEMDGGYGDDGNQVRTFAMCKDCGEAYR